MLKGFAACHTQTSRLRQRTESIGAALYLVELLRRRDPRLWRRLQAVLGHAATMVAGNAKTGDNRTLDKWCPEEDSNLHGLAATGT